MDADDMMHPRRLEMQYKLLTESSPNTVAGSAAYVIDSESRILGIRRARNVKRVGFAASGSFIHPTVMASAEWFRRYRYSENPSFFRSEDAELWIRSAAGSEFINSQEPLLYYREATAPSVEKYAGSTLGTVVIGTRLAAKSRFEALRVVTTKLLKLWLMCATDIIGHSRRVPHRRFAAIALAEKAAAEGVIARIKNTPVAGLELGLTGAVDMHETPVFCLATHLQNPSSRASQGEVEANHIRALTLPAPFRVDFVQED
jgi:hypothetical protein